MKNLLYVLIAAFLLLYVGSCTFDREQDGVYEFGVDNGEIEEDDVSIENEEIKEDDI